MLFRFGLLNALQKKLTSAKTLPDHIPLLSSEGTEIVKTIDVPIISVDILHTKLEFREPINYPTSSRNKSLVAWKMEVDDAPIFRYIYRNFQPKRHLEFGTWLGHGTLYCLEESSAIVWTINLPFGERDTTGHPVYYSCYQQTRTNIKNWARKVGIQHHVDRDHTDSIGFIGKLYIEKGLGKRVCQIYCDSREWDTANYPSDFFDTILIDGGHQEEIVNSDTFKALPLLRSGGIVMWHDFCPKADVYEHCPATRGVFNAIHANREWLNAQLKDMFWINPSHILIGIKK